MARELKFRVFNKSESRMVLDSVECIFTQDGRVFEGGIECNGVVMQYTGMLDKNGVEIYEADVVLRNNYSNYIVDLDNNGWLGMYYDLPSEEYEVIGNIYNNPDLLNDCE
jgi:hypothetical protein